MPRPRRHHSSGLGRHGWRRARRALPVLALVLATFLLVGAAAPAGAHAIDLFPLDDLVGGGLKKLGDAAIGGLKIGVKELAKLLAGLVTALADLLVPDSVIRAGLSGIRWLVSIPQLGLAPGQSQLPASHLGQLRDSLTWIALLLLPAQLFYAGGRAILSPSLNHDSPGQVAGRAIVAAIGLLTMDWSWGAMTSLSNLVTGSLLRLPWVEDGVGQMLKTLVIGTGGAAAVAEFILPLVLVAAGGALLVLLLLRIALEVFASLLWVVGGLALGLSPSQLGHRFLQAWLISVAAVFVLPVAWTIVFVTGAALMLDANTVPEGSSGFAKLLTQLFNLGAALVVFVVAIKIAQAVFKRTGASLDALKGSVTSRGSAVGGGGRGGPGRSQTPGAVAANSPRLRAWVPRAGAAAASAASFPLRHPVRTAQAGAYPARHPAQATQEAADSLRGAMHAARGAAGGAAGAAGAALRAERHGGRFSTRSAAARASARTANGNGNGTPADSPSPPPAAGTRSPDAARAARRAPGAAAQARTSSPRGSTPPARPPSPPAGPHAPSGGPSRPTASPRDAAVPVAPPTAPPRQASNRPESRRLRLWPRALGRAGSSSDRDRKKR